MRSAASCTSATRATPHLIAVAGPSCAGKTALARALVAALPDAVHVPLDAYYADRSHLPIEQRTHCNFDAPEALDADLLCAHVGRLASGLPVDAPIYDFVTHGRSANAQRIQPGTHIIIEGLFALHFAQLLPLYTYCVYVDADPDLCLQRRLARDAAERGRGAEAIRRQFAEQVYPMAQQYVIPTHRHADCIAPGSRPLDQLVQFVLSSYKAATKNR